MKFKKYGFNNKMIRYFITNMGIFLNEYILKVAKMDQFDKMGLAKAIVILHISILVDSVKVIIY